MTCDVCGMEVTGSRMSVPTAEKLRMVEVEVISAALRRPPVPSDLLQPFSHLQLAADSPASDSTPHVDLVIGRVLYWALVRSGPARNGEHSCLPSG